ncbi:uncharacterized protein [Lepisosteus oculatus]|uniref:uncharacterized protein isoform X1 n=1 Tax=Lepisosteus oculatus TaxID=7918 RepID=UPI003716555E
MAGAQCRRKSCLFRLSKENCPFRRLRKTTAYEIRNPPSASTVERWGAAEQTPSSCPPQPLNGIAQVYIEPRPPEVYCPAPSSPHQSGAQCGAVNHTCLLHVGPHPLLTPRCPCRPPLDSALEGAVMDADPMLFGLVQSSPGPPASLPASETWTLILTPRQGRERWADDNTLPLLCHCHPGNSDSVPAGPMAPGFYANLRSRLRGQSV